MPDPDMSVWTGRIDTADGPNALRWHQMVKPLAADSPPGVALIGFACDEGVRRNGGRVGAKDGPRAIRAALANLAWHQERPVYDTGDVRCDDGDMEGTQMRLADVVERAIRAGHRPLVLGGGHEMAWGTFQGIVTARPDASVGVINIDAHLDLRADEPGNSGTPFNQIAKWFGGASRPFRYLCLGVAEPSNTATLFDRLGTLGGEYIPDVDFLPWGRQEPRDYIDEFIRRVEQVHLSVDLDVLPAATMPAVSAPAAHGLALETVEAILDRTLMSEKVAAIDLVELNPRFDIDSRGARVAARLVWQITKSWDRKGDWA
ncbi:formimidoylglutamase [Frigoriglobus tundricola]|uniref:Formimidoylglutamase n=1 Tax=Frigoriglobus tundricola TaxID=2774151 RepID=A0A6M5YLH1_9BACT|nr:formimidoylglutamase [Frigoriglobus tundricola]QJW93842.1 Formiminoglutamase [Frigoriglobus tundricola]